MVLDFFKSKLFFVVSGISISVAVVTVGVICGTGQCGEPSQSSSTFSNTNGNVDITEPSVLLSSLPSVEPFNEVSPHPSGTPNMSTSGSPTVHVTSSSLDPSQSSSTVPSVHSTFNLSDLPSMRPTSQPTLHPSDRSSTSPSLQSSVYPTNTPTKLPTYTSSLLPSLSPNIQSNMSPSLRPSTLSLEGMSGALVTSDCLFQDYAYAIDIFWSCGDERFNNPLRLHTFKRHSYQHQLIFADQLITYRNHYLWFEEYSRPRCISVGDDGELMLETSESDCNEFIFVSNNAYIQDAATGECITLGEGVSCEDDRSTGGSECDGVDHRYLPLAMGPCDNALAFEFQSIAEDCSNGENEYPGNSCF